MTGSCVWHCGTQDLASPGGALALVSDAATEWFSKGYEPYTQGSVDDYYLNLTVKKVNADVKTDLLAVTLLSNYSEMTWRLVESAVPPMVSAGVRTWVGSRGPSVDTTFGDLGEPANNYGIPSVSTYVANLTAKAAGDPPILNFRSHFNATHIADGLVGGHLPIAHFVIPISRTSPYYPLPNMTGSSIYWDMVVAGVPDMQGSRDQGVWQRFQQILCTGAASPYSPTEGAEEGKQANAPHHEAQELHGDCKLRGEPIYFDTYWWTHAPDGNTNLTGPVQSASAAGFYGNLLDVRTWWHAELAKEGMMDLSLPAPTSTNGTYLKTQAVASIIRQMLTRQQKWGPRYGVMPGYGINMQNGFQDTFTTRYCQIII